MQNKNGVVEIPIDILADNPTEIEVRFIEFPPEKKSVQNVKKVWKKIPKLLVIILLLEVISIYGLLFFIAPKTTYPAAANLPNEDIISADRLIALTNELRNEYNLNPLSQNQYLNQAAENKANYILTNQNFSHTGLNGESFSYWIKQTNYHYQRVGENLAINYQDPETVISAWLNSPSHRKNILNPLYHEIGLAAVSGNFQGKSTTVVVQIFGTPE